MAIIPTILHHITNNTETFKKNKFVNYHYSKKIVYFVHRNIKLTTP